MPSYFLDYFNLESFDDNFDPYYIALVSTYFALTTLTTIGFGDYYPITDSERLVIAFLFLSGVTIFSYFMGVFLEILNTYSLFNQ
jgi:hypothetical protein